MSEKETTAVIEKFAVVARILSHRWGMPWEWEEIRSEMCCAFARKNGNLKDKSLAYIIEVCKNEAINNYFKGKSICSKPRKGLKIVSFDELPEYISTERKFEQDVYNKILVERIFGLLTEREIQIAELIMEGYIEQEMAENLGISRQRVNYIKKNIREKAKRILSYWNFNKLKSQQHLILQYKVLDSDRYLSTIRPSIFAKRCCPEGKIARAKRVPIWNRGLQFYRDFLLYK